MRVHRGHRDIAELGGGSESRLSPAGYVDCNIFIFSQEPSSAVLAESTVSCEGFHRIPKLTKHRADPKLPPKANDSVGKL
jgi:hypothetical protein